MAYFIIDYTITSHLQDYGLQHNAGGYVTKPYIHFE